MFSEIEDAIISALQGNLKAVQKENISTKKPDFSVKGNLPAVSIGNVDFKFAEVGVGRSVDTTSKEAEETFSGDGEKKSFTLSRKPVRPILSVEHPAGMKGKENVDFVVDYRKGMITFQSAPKEGSENVMVKYLLPFETRGVKLNLRYHITVWSRDMVQRDKITVDVIRTLLKEEEAFNSKGIFIKPLEGFNSSSDEVPEGIFGKTVEYIVEAYLHVEIPRPRIEKIEIEEKGG